MATCGTTATNCPLKRPRQRREGPPAKASGTAVNYVLMGSDSRDVGNAGHGRSDVLMVMHLAADRKSAYMISFPRDMYVPIPGHGKNKINAAFAFGGPPLTVRTLEGLLNTRMDHVALIDFEGFIKLTEELGGVKVYNKYARFPGGYSFPVGDVNLRGEQALAYVRERKQLPTRDLDRAERQRVVLRAILAKGLAKETITNPFKFVNFVRGVSHHVSVDDRLTEKELRKTALSLRLSPKDIHMLQAPISGLGTSPTRQSIDIVDKKKLAQLAKALRNDQMDNYLEKYPEGIEPEGKARCRPGSRSAAAVGGGTSRKPRIDGRSAVMLGPVRRKRRVLPLAVLAILVAVNAALIALLLRSQSQVTAEPAGQLTIGSTLPTQPPASSPAQGESPSITPNPFALVHTPH